MGALCKNASEANYELIDQSCFPCTVKLTTIDAPYANLYGFSELFIISMSSTVGFRIYNQGEPVAKSHYDCVVSGHGFSPADVNQRLLHDKQSEFTVL